MASKLSESLGRWCAAVRAIAQTGFAYTQSTYERERYEELLRITSELAAALSEGEDVDEELARRLVDEWRSESNRGPGRYVTPKVVVNAAVFNEQERLLLVQRLDRGTWFLPGGWADVGYAPSEVAVKEVAEETGLTVAPIRLIAVLDGFRHQFSLGLAFYCLVYECQLVGGELRPLSHECRDARFFAENEMPDPLHGDGRWAKLLFALHRNEIPLPYSD